MIAMIHEKLWTELEELRSKQLSIHTQEWIKALEGFLDIFVSQAILSGEAFDRVLKYEILEIIEKAMADLTIEENRKYRDGQPKSPWRALLFILSKDVGHTPVPNEKGAHLRMLDYRHTDKDTLKVGEGQEALDALQNYDEQLAAFSMSDEEPNEVERELEKAVLNRLALEVLVEISDLFYNWAQLRLGLGDEERENYDLSIFTDRFVGQDKKQVEDLIVFLTSLSVWKFSFRYFELGEKRPDEEADYLLEKMEQIHLSPRKLIENNWTLIMELIEEMLHISYQRIQSLAKTQGVDKAMMKAICKKIIRPAASY